MEERERNGEMGQTYRYKEKTIEQRSDGIIQRLKIFHPHVGAAEVSARSATTASVRINTDVRQHQTGKTISVLYMRALTRNRKQERVKQAVAIQKI